MRLELLLILGRRLLWVLLILVLRVGRHVCGVVAELIIYMLDGVDSCLDIYRLVYGEVVRCKYAEYAMLKQGRCCNAGGIQKRTSQGKG